MKRLQPLALWLFLWVGLSLFLCHTSFAQGPASTSNERPLSDFLTENGTFQNTDGYSGSLNPSGFSLSVQEDGTPVFRNSSSNDSNDNWTWESALPGANKEVRAILVYDGYLYVGGDFTNIAGIAVGYIARYNFSTKIWSGLGSGVSKTPHSDQKTVFSLAASNNFLYVGGAFENAGNKPVYGIARYDLSEDNGNSSWSSLGDGLKSSTTFGTAKTILISKNILYVGGGQIWRYNLNEDNGNESWSFLGDGVDGRVNALTVFGEYLFVGGDFKHAGSKYIVNFARYNLSEDNGNESWYSVDVEVSIGEIHTFIRDGNYLYISARSGDIPSLIQFNMETSEAEYLLRGEAITDLAIIDNDLYFSRALRDYTVPGGYISTIYRYDIIEETWESLYNEFDGSILTLESSDGRLYVGGEFKRVGDVPAENIAYSDFSSSKPNWKALGGQGLNADVSALLVHDNILYVGGRVFTSVGGILASNIARYDLNTHEWKGFGDGLEGHVVDLALIDDFLYVAGRGYIIRYNLKEDNGNSSWSAVGSLTNSNNSNDEYDTYAFADLTMITQGNLLIVGGRFRTLESRFSSTKGSAKNSIARFNTVTETWSGFGDGLQVRKSDSNSEYIEGTVNGLAIIGSHLYVGGGFSYRSGNNFDYPNLARYNLKEDNGYSSWSAIYTDDPTYVYDMVSKGEELIVAGDFDNHGDSGINIGSYNTVDESWHVFNGDITGGIHDLALIGNNLFIGGTFEHAGNIEANRIVQLNLESGEWSRLGDGVKGIVRNTYSSVRALATHDNDLYVGGFFTEAGGKPASSLARWSGAPQVPLRILHFDPENNSVGISVHPKLDWQHDEVADSYELIVSESEYFFDPVIHEPALDPSSYQITDDLEYSTTYHWKVRGANENGSGPWSDLWSFTTAAGPVPDQITLQSPEDTATDIPLQPTLNWQADDEADEYRLMLSESSDFSDPLIHQEGIQSTSFQISEDLDYDHTYYWQVRGANTFGKGPWSKTWSFTTIPSPVPEKVVLKSPDNDSQDIQIQPILGWNEADEADSYELVLSENPDLSNPVLYQSEILETTFQLSQSLDYDKTYYWQVRGTNEFGEGPWSETWSFTTVALPDQVVLSSPTNTSADIQLQPELRWQTADEALSYELVVSANPDLSNPLMHPTGLQVTTFQIPEDLAYEETYYWHVRGTNEHGNGPWSETWNFTTIPPPVPTLVSLLSPANNSTDIPLQPELTWEPSGETESYELILSPESNLSDPLLHLTNIQETTVKLTEDLAYNQMYYWQVRGVNMYNEGSWSEVWNFTTLAPGEVALDPNWPNPFSNATAGTTIRYRLPAESQVRLEVYDISGRRVAVLVDQVMLAGEYDVPFNGSGLAGGVYFYRLVTGDKSIIHKMLMVK